MGRAGRLAEAELKTVGGDGLLEGEAVGKRAGLLRSPGAQLGGPRPAEGAWASTRNAGKFDITLRIYQPAASAQASFASIPMPRVERLSCGERS